MANLGDIATFNIYFHDGESGGGSGGGGDGTVPGTPTDPIQPGQPDPKNPTKSKGGIKQIAALATVKQLGKSALNFATSHVQTWTGSSDMQQKVNAGMSMAGTAVAIAANPALGLAMLAFDLATKAIDYNYKRQQEMRQVQQNLLRAGPNFNRSRREGAA